MYDGIVVRVDVCMMVSMITRRKLGQETIQRFEFRIHLYANGLYCK